MTLSIHMLAEAISGGAMECGIGTIFRDDAQEIARAVLSAIDAAGWAVVPRQATEDMVAAWISTDWPEQESMSQNRWNAESAQADWSAMIQSAPKIGDA